MSALALMAAIALTTGTAWATLPVSYVTDSTVVGSHETVTGLHQGAFTVKNGANVTITGTESIENTASTGDSVGMMIHNGNLNAEGVTVSMSPDTNSNNVISKGILVRGTSNAKIDTLNSTVTLRSINGVANGSADSNASYGVAVGYDYGGSGSAATLTVNNANIKVSNTADTIRGAMVQTKSQNAGRMGSAKVTAKLDTGHQLTGIKVYRSNGAVANFEANGPVSISVTDSSTTKSGDYLVGVYASGNASKAVFNRDLSIQVAANGVNSAGVKVGKPVTTGDSSEGITPDGVTVEAKGNTIIDTTQTVGTATIFDKDLEGSGAVRTFAENSKFIISDEHNTNTSAIKASTNAVVFDTSDYVTGGTLTMETTGLASWVIPSETHKEVFSRNTSNINNEVSLTNTVLTTTSDTASLIKAKAQTVTQGAVLNAFDSYAETAKNFGFNFNTAAYKAAFTSRLNQGNFNVKNARFTLRGERSLATAANKGWVVESTGDEHSTAELTAIIEDQARMIGQMHKEQNSVLNVIVDNRGTWELAPKQDLNTQLSTINNLALSNEGVLNAGTHLTDSDRAEYTIKLSSDGVANDGILANGGIITMVNGKYSDILTIDGDYDGQGGLVKMDTRWESPGNDTGANSASDLLHITGKATGTSVVVPVAADGTEKIIDGSIGSIAADLNAVTIPVVKVDNGNDTGAPAFTGTAKTTGAGELQLATRINNGVREFYWTVTAVNPIPPTPTPDPTPSPDPTPNPVPIYDNGVSGYVQMPQVDLDLGYASMRTLHERRGENHQLLSTSADDIDQTWARVINDYKKVDGKHRLSYDNHIRGLQVGHDFKITKNDNGDKRFTGAYFSYLQGTADFKDRYRAVNGIISNDSYTGSGKAKSYALGVTSTRYNANGAYLDLVGQVSLIDNEYTARGKKSVDQDGWSLGVSAEVGRPYTLRNWGAKKLILEPQAQLIYQYLSLEDMYFDNKSIQYPGQYGLKGRLGARIAYNTYNEDNTLRNTLYGVANVWQDLSGADSVRIGNDTIAEKYGRTVAEIGVGAQWKLSNNSYIYGDFRYEHNLGSGHYEGYRGNVGFKFNW